MSLVVESIENKVVVGAKWAGVSQFGRQALIGITLVLLARLLPPEDFGLAAMAAAAVVFANVLSDMGLASAVIRSPRLSTIMLSGLWWANMVMGVIASLILVAIAAPLATFYHEPRVAPLLKGLALVPLFTGFASLQRAILERKLAFNTLARIEIIAAAGGGGVAVAGAFIGAGAWSIILQSVVTQAIMLFLLWKAAAFVPMTFIHWKAIRNAVKFGAWLASFSIINLIGRNTDNFIIGRVLGATALGVYGLAYQMMLYPLFAVTSALGRVLYPALSRFSNNKRRLGRAYLRAIGAIALVSFPLLIGLWSLAVPFVHTVFGSRWTAVIPLLMILIPVGLFQSISSTVGILYQIMGKTDLMFKWIVPATALGVLSFLIGVHWGVYGVVVCYAIANAILAWPCFSIPFGLIGLKVSHLKPTLGPPLAASLTMGMVLVSGEQMMRNHIMPLIRLAILIPVGIVVYYYASKRWNRCMLLYITKHLGLRKYISI